MWIEHIGTIAMGFFVFLIAVHFGLHLWFKWQRIKQTRLKSMAKPPINTEDKASS
ncbi:hypothetical protein [Thiomicrorhabdus aquaedulcis]|uniref:hypothetical protein n=1 Tax=Thiomicrorhabdus aquaedulcis TaxID=2211106 RepID=UPI0015628C48|nr:hypothetical protein [Thiomicrorhabdus aquaedulcis]